MDRPGSWGGPDTEKQAAAIWPVSGVAEQASSAAEVTARFSVTSNCPESGLSWNLAVLPRRPMLGSRAGTHTLGAPVATGR